MLNLLFRLNDTYHRIRLDETSLMAYLKSFPNIQRKIGKASCTKSIVNRVLHNRLKGVKAEITNHPNNPNCTAITLFRCGGIQPTVVRYMLVVGREILLGANSRFGGAEPSTSFPLWPGRYMREQGMGN